MKKYSVNKFYGHFWQCFIVEANSEEDAWNRAEKDGKLHFQNVYRAVKDLDSKGYVIDLAEEKYKNRPISQDEYWEWMKEAVEKGMRVKPWEYEKIYGLPFYDV